MKDADLGYGTLPRVWYRFWATLPEKAFPEDSLGCVALVKYKKKLYRTNTLSSYWISQNLSTPVKMNDHSPSPPASAPKHHISCIISCIARLHSPLEHSPHDLVLGRDDMNANKFVPKCCVSKEPLTPSCGERDGAGGRGLKAPWNPGIVMGGRQPRCFDKLCKISTIKMGDVIGGAVSLVSLLKKAYDLYTACQAAPEEIRLASDHVHCMALVLEGVKSDLVKNGNSFLHQSNDIAKTRKFSLKIHITHCDKALERMQRLMKKYQGFRKQHVRAWDRFRWSTEGKKEIADCKADLVMATSMLDLFLSKEGLSVLWKLESMMEIMMKKFAALEMFQANMPTNPTTRARSGSNVGRTLVLSLVISRLRKCLRQYRRRKAGNSKKKPQNPGPRRPKPVTRVSSGFGPNKKRDNMLQDYAWSNIANASTTAGKPSRSRTPPGEYYDPNSKFPTAPLRRSSSMKRLMSKINAQAAKPKGDGEHLECWKVGTGSTAFGMRVPPQFLSHKRGQMQLRKMAAIFKDASTFDGRGLSEQDKRVKLILDVKNNKEKKNNSRKRWYLDWYDSSGESYGDLGQAIVHADDKR
ncbi:uncharacterized protein BDR25DRAFT_348848 [Lindgomyces ingoldianus]|uniref:Uncharacterized protein n=1 Tax=Lindgomyces ingoldianus TaxID=673940 RepID=A0ACB6RCE8_9PLEO|nr:uncharacterized protein BDR25DRAFT_348848 [Lindgomyces ingoldianus]KAF2476934.1 hypothetical protein BDR25DRAFT_348848 [Lindgomyces ingoldianus]